MPHLSIRTLTANNLQLRAVRYGRFLEYAIDVFPGLPQILKARRAQKVTCTILISLSSRDVAKRAITDGFGLIADAHKISAANLTCLTFSNLNRFYNAFLGYIRG